MFLASRDRKKKTRYLEIELSRVSNSEIELQYLGPSFSPLLSPLTSSACHSCPWWSRHEGHSCQHHVQSLQHTVNEERKFFHAPIHYQRPSSRNFLADFLLFLIAQDCAPVLNIWFTKKKKKRIKWSWLTLTTTPHCLRGWG